MSSTDWYSAVGMFLRFASSWVSDSMVLPLPAAVDRAGLVDLAMVMPLLVASG
ncbi:hypothetical protein [Accumulibacter sp.]|uniref:hypothetical protein n=1 Tax=Accumulibacter sp. TaxID=2053492 RepID=UPI0025D95F05|nr:hypothetical protein [Accumulibacter sp.]